MSTASITQIADLKQDRLLHNADTAALNRVVARYALAIPPHLRRQLKQSPSSPLLKQFLPDVRELETTPDDRADPIGDSAHTPVPGIVHRYQNRALLKIVAVCPVYCRFCFRREMIGPGETATLSKALLERALAYIRQAPELEEIIVTGGDPLILSPRRIENLTQVLSEIPHIKRIRWHSRVPVVAPERVTDEVLGALTQTSKLVRVAVHINHRDELNADARNAIDRLKAAGVILLSQSVLLKGVNDTSADLQNLFAAFSDLGIMPYYLHQLDLAPGTHHFRVPIRNGHALLHHVSQTRPDLKRPQYMLDIPGGYGKISLTTEWIRLIERRQTGDLYRARDPLGKCHIYWDPAPCA